MLTENFMVRSVVSSWMHKNWHDECCVYIFLNDWCSEKCMHYDSGM